MVLYVLPLLICPRGVVHGNSIALLSHFPCCEEMPSLVKRKQ